MPYILRPERWRRQPSGLPTIASDNSLTVGLVAAWLPTCPIINLVSRQKGTLPTYTIKLSDYAAGRGLWRSDSVDSCFVFPLKAFSNQKMTVAGLYQWVTTNDENFRTEAAALANSATVTTDKKFRVGPNSYDASSITESRLAWYGASGSLAFDDVVGNSWKPMCAAGSFDGSTHRAAVNGKIIGEGAASMAGEDVSSFHVARVKEPVLFGAAWNRALSAAELQAVSLNPWQLFAPDPGRVWFFPAGGGSTYNLDFAESASASDSVSSVATLAASVSEAASAADACSSAATLLATVAEALTASDTATSSATLAAAIAETLSAADQVSAGAATYAVDIAEAANAADAVSSVLTAAASVVETATAADTVSSVATLIAALAESVTAGDSVSSSTSGSTYNVSIAEAVAALDAFSAQFDLAAAIAEAASASDSTTSSAVLAAAVTEALAALDAVSAAGIFGVTITESANATDSVSAPTGFGETPASRTITVQRGGRTITVQLHGRTITVH